MEQEKITKIETCFYRISAKALIFDESRTKFLVSKTLNEGWDILGGGLDWGESPTQGITREIREETRIEVTSVNEHPQHFCTYKLRPESPTWRAAIFFETTIKDMNFIPSNECVALRFVTPEEAVVLELLPSAHFLAQALRVPK